MKRGLIPVILCGGAGERLEPISTPNLPKQFLPLHDELSLFELTLERAQRCRPGATVRIVTTVSLEPLARAQTKGNVDFITEPLRRNTAAAVALAAQSANPDDLLWIMPCDHIIQNEAALSSALTQAALLSKGDYIVLIGIKPASANTGYGYIQTEGFTVTAFHEKPDGATAQRYLDQGNYSWNSGMVIARAEIIVQAFAQCAPEYLSPASYPALPPLSFDKAVLEKMNDLVMVKADMGWRDIGQPEDRVHFEKTRRTN